MGLTPRERIERIQREASLRGISTGEAQRQNGRPVEFVTLTPNEDGGDTIAPFVNPRATNTFNGFRPTLPTLPHASTSAAPGPSNGFQLRLPTSARVAAPVVAGPSNFFHPQSSTNSGASVNETREPSQTPGDEDIDMGFDDSTALEPPSMKGEQKRRQDSAFATSTQDSTALEPDAGFDIERRRKKAKLATEEPQVWLSHLGNLRTGMPGPSTPPIATRAPAEPQASAAPKALFATPMEFFTSPGAFARPEAVASPATAGSVEGVASPEAAASHDRAVSPARAVSPDRAVSPEGAASSQAATSPPASASSEPLPPNASNTAPPQDTATPGPSLPLSSIQPQASANPGLPSASTSSAAPPQAAAGAPPTTRQVSLHRDMTPYIGARPIPQWLTDLAREIRAADTDPQGRPKTAALKKVTNTFVRDGQTLSHFSPASGVLRVGARWSPLWEWWMDTRVLTPAQWWRVNEVDWKMKSEGYKELPNGCYGVNVPAV